MEVLFTDTRKHEQFWAGLQQLTELAVSGRLTCEQLDQAMRAMYDDGDCIDQSIGFTWLCQEPDLFGQVAVRLGFKVSDFLLEHGDLCWVGSRILLYPCLLALIPEEEREGFVRQVYCRYGAFNESWIRVVLEAGGVPRATISELLLERLERVRDDCDSANCGNDVWDFLRFGHRGYRDEPTSWNILTDDQFRLALDICARKSPREFFENRGQIEQRLGSGSAGKAELTELGRAVIMKVKSLTPAQQRFVEEQDIDFRIAVARNLKTGAASVIPLLVQLVPDQGAQLFAELAPMFEGGGIASVYRSTWEIRHREGKPLAPWLEAELKARLTAAGYFLGTVTEGWFTPRGKSQAIRQHEVKDGAKGVTFIWDRYQTGYYPQVGDEVLIYARGAHWLTDYVARAAFLPARHGQPVG